MAYLMHHGIKGQKWGVRRYQNEDGSLTSAGRARYDDGDGGSKFGKSKLGFSNKQVSKSNPSGKRKPKMSSEQKKALAKKIAIGVGATAVVAATAYLASKGIKARADDLLVKDYNRKVRTMFDQTTALNKNVYNDKFMDLRTKNDIVRNNNLTANAHFGAYKQLYTDKRGKINRSTWQAIKYLRGK